MLFEKGLIKAFTQTRLDHQMSGTTKLSEFVCNLSYEDIPAPCAKRIKMAILDTIGCILLGTATEAAGILLEHVRKSDTRKEATIPATKIKLSCASAALVNGTMGHEFDYDDGISTALGIHAGITIIPAALAIAEKEKASGRDLISAVTVGYELACRIGRVIEKAQHAPILTGTFGATAASARLLGANHDQMQNALGICGSLSPLRPFDAALEGAMVKDLWAGWSNFFGVFCASLAVDGFTGTKGILDGSRGFYKAATLGGDVDTSVLTDYLGKSFLWMDGHYFKPYPSCRGTHVTLDAVLRLAQECRIDPNEIKEIFVIGRPIVCTLKGELNPISARFSTPYVVAAAIICGQLTLNEFTRDKLQDPRIADLANKVKTLIDPDIPEYPHAHGPVDIVIRFRNGSSVTSRAGEDRSLSYDEVETKFRENANRVLKNDAVNRLIRMMKNLEELKDVQMLTDALSLQ